MSGLNAHEFCEQNGVAHTGHTLRKIRSLNDFSRGGGFIVCVFACYCYIGK